MAWEGFQNFIHYFLVVSQLSRGPQAIFKWISLNSRKNGFLWVKSQNFHPNPSNPSLFIWFTSGQISAMLYLKAHILSDIQCWQFFLSVINDHWSTWYKQPMFVMVTMFYFLQMEMWRNNKWSIISFNNFSRETQYCHKLLCRYKWLRALISFSLPMSKVSNFHAMSGFKIYNKDQISPVRDSQSSNRFTDS